jgi:glycosyltransferase involved in cell wall biosynthesis
VVDDGSTDDTAAVATRYADRVTLIRGRHGGYAAARNLGLRRVQGSWIAFHDADDVALPNRLAFQTDCLREHPGCDAILCNGEYTDAAGAPAGGTVVRPALARACSGRPLTGNDLFAGFPAFLQGALLSRAAVEAVGEFDTSLSVYTDMEYFYRFLARFRAVFVDRVVFRYRRHDANVTGDRLAGRRDIVRILEGLEERDPVLVAQIGRRRLRRRLARHYYRIGRRCLSLGDAEGAHPALARAAALRPFDPRYQLARLVHRGRSS